MKRISIVFVGAGGYAGYTLGLLRDHVDADRYELVGVVDPFVEKAAIYGWLKEARIPLFNTLQEFYAQGKAELAIISSPIHLHKEQCLTALKNGSHVLCEKPITARIQDARELEETARAAGLLLAVGFQWSFYPTVLRAKQDLLSGRFGRPEFLKSYIAWRRFDSYYSGDWKGRIRSRDGNWLLDSVTTNATAHYLHNIFFMMGSELETSAFPKSVRASVYRAKDIQSFDTAAIAGEFDGGARFLYLASHSTEEEHNPLLEYQFEKAVLRADLSSGSPDLIATFQDGSTENYGSLDSNDYNIGKVSAMLSAIAEHAPLTCPVPSVYPHLTVCNAIFDQLDIENFPPALCVRMQGGNGDAGTFVGGLYQQLMECWRQGQLPSKLGYPWAIPEQELQLEGYSEFSGKKFC